MAYRAGDPLPKLGPEARVDLGLRAAAEELAANATTLDARPAPAAVRLALGRAGYPGEAHFFRVKGGADLPPEILDTLPRDQPLDVGWAWRDFGDGTRWWVVGWALRYVQLDPLPRDPSAHTPLALRVDGPSGLRLYLGRPDGRVEQPSFEAGTTRILRLEGGPGEYRVEVVGAETVALLFSLYVDTSLPAASPLPGVRPVEDPMRATGELYAKVDALRSEAGLPLLPHFEPFEPYARSHAACLAAHGQLLHRSADCPGVPDATAAAFAPRARLHEDLAVALDADEIWDLWWGSPGHRANLLCRECTHSAIGAAIEPTAAPRLVVAWEGMDFPAGVPEPVRRSW